MKTEYRTCVEPIRGKSFSGSTISGGDSLGEALKSASETAIYLLSLLDVDRVRVTITAQCAVCSGRGRIAHARQSFRSPHRTRVCPECKGRPEGSSHSDPIARYELSRPHGALLTEMPAHRPVGDGAHSCGAMPGEAHRPDCDAARRTGCGAWVHEGAQWARPKSARDYSSGGESTECGDSIARDDVRRCTLPRGHGGEHDAKAECTCPASDGLGDAFHSRDCPAY